MDSSFQSSWPFADGSRPLPSATRVDPLRNEQLRYLRTQYPDYAIGLMGLKWTADRPKRRMVEDTAEELEDAILADLAELAARRP